MMDIIWIIWKWIGIAIAGGAALAVAFFAVIGLMMLMSYKG